jgi:carbonic anhydrase
MHHAAHPRRSFLKLATFGAGAALLSAGLPMASARAGGQAEVLLLSCMDYRLLDEIAYYMDGRGLTNKYDHVILAGASLGALVDAKPEWGATFWNHVDVAKQLHHIHKVMIIDHRDCGAYKVFIGPETAKDRETETQCHTEQLRKLAAALAARHSDLSVELLLMSLDGTVEPVTVTA